MHLITTNSVSYLTSESYQERKRWEEKQSLPANVGSLAAFLGLIVVIGLYALMFQPK